MDKFARLAASERSAVFGETSARRGVASIIIEKDFWVWWTLKRLFALKREDAGTQVFEGGTPLSKAYSAIRRFSEDVDLSFHGADLGYVGERDPEREGISGRLIEALMLDVGNHITGKVLPALRVAVAEQLGEPEKAGWSIEVDADDPQTVNFHFPAAPYAGRVPVDGPARRLPGDAGDDVRRDASHVWGGARTHRKIAGDDQR